MELTENYVIELKKRANFFSEFNGKWIKVKKNVRVICKIQRPDAGNPTAPIAPICLFQKEMIERRSNQWNNRKYSWKTWCLGSKDSPTSIYKYFKGK